MRLATVRSGDATHAVVADADAWAPLGVAALDEAFQDNALENVIALADAALARPERLSSDEVELLAPLRAPRKIVCCGLNYRDHIIETGRETPRHPTLFGKFADTLTGPTADIVVTGSDEVDWEAELAVVVGAPLRRADRAAAARGILGYTIANDVSMRDWQSRTLQWMQGKCWDATTPLGPVVVTADEFDPAMPHEIGAAIDGVTMQRSTTDQLLFDAPALVSYVSQFTALAPGDLLLTGTPGGVGLGRSPRRYLRDGEQLTTWVEGIGELRNRFRIDGLVIDGLLVDAPRQTQAPQEARQ